MRLTRKRILSTGIILGVILLGGSAWAVLRGSSSDIDAARLATVERGDVAKSVVATGRIEPISKVEIKSKANGIVKEIKVEVGDRVKVGQVLAELDKDNLAARLREARAALNGAQANVTSAAEAEFEKNKVEAEGPDVPFARRNLERAETLFTRQAGAPADAGRCAQRARDGREPPAGRQDPAGRGAGASMAQARAVGGRRPGGRGARGRGARPTPPSGRPSTAWCSRARSNSAAPCRPS